MSAPETQRGVTYGGYLRLDQILTAQAPRSGADDELLFIIIHQASELWIKLCVHELGRAMADIDADRLRPAFKHLARVARIQEQLLQSWDVLGTMTPTDYSTIRPHLGPSSGFQSHQYRLMEFLCGTKNKTMADMHAPDPVPHGLLVEALHAPGLYDRALRLLARRGFAIAPEQLERDFSRPYAAHESVEAAWMAIYRDPETHWDLYELAEKLVDFEMRFQQWRFAHVRTVERIIGNKMGTGGTNGVSYLSKVIDNRFFPELMSMRTAL